MKTKNYTIVTTPEQLAELKSHINQWDFFAFDTETTGLNVRKDKVIGLSVSGEVGAAFYLPRFTWDKTFHCLRPVWNDGVFQEIVQLLAQKELLMWNASFDIRIVKNNLGIDLTEALLADIMLMKHTVEEEGDFGLKKVAIQYQDQIGLGDMEAAANEEQIRLKENVKANGGSTTQANYEMYKADLGVMGQYACADADLTLRLAELFRQRVESEGQESFYYDKEVMPLYKHVTIPMESPGVDLDLPLIHATRDKVIALLAKYESSISAQLDAIPEVIDWKWSKALEMYPPKATGAFAQALVEYLELPLPKTAAGKFSLTAKLISNLPDSSGKVFLQTGQFPDPEDYNAKAILNYITRQLYQKSGDDKINISSKMQMGQIAFDCLGFKPLGTTASGKPQFDDDMIQHLAEKGIAWAKDLSNYNKLVKIKGTYIDRFLDAQEDGKYYPSFFQHRTISGRYGSDLQQLPRPKEDGELSPDVLEISNTIRQFFIAGKGRKFIDNDYESLEPHVFAHVSGDEGLRDIFRKGHDFYSTIAIATEKMEGVSADKKAENYLGKVNKQARQKAKAYALGIPYGMTPYALGKSLGMTTAEAQVLYDGYLDGFPMLKAWMEDSKRQAQINGFVKSETGRVRHLPKVAAIYKKHGDQLLNYMYVKGLEKRARSPEDKARIKYMVMDYKNGVNNSRNFQIQSLGASIVNMAAIAINKEFKRRGIDGWVALQIHDQLVMNVPEERAKECAELVQHIMETNYQLSLKLKAPAQIATNLRDGH